ncbi:MAG: hypothetical protein L6V84_00025 [Oscillospiraceae bacterium]|nr:MAG: hypothetical protein L6V84_00025 [Oscillospiraceae bacterium]
MKQPSPAKLHAPRQYALGQSHKHLPEMSAVSGLPPPCSALWSAILQRNAGHGPAVRGAVRTGNHERQIARSTGNLQGTRGPLHRSTGRGRFLSAASLSGKDSMQISVSGNEERMLLLAVYDNLGKGASGAALECLNMILDTDPCEGLCL